MLDQARCGHEIIPRPGTARRADGSLADLRNPLHYPVTAACDRCGREIRCNRYLTGEWRHVCGGDQQ